MNYYDVLGISRDANEKEIKTAFRKLAAKHHPDKGGDHKKFVEIKEAYETLNDPQKRAYYDNYGQNNAGGSGFDFRNGEQFGSQFGYGFDDIMADMFGQHSGFSDIFGRRAQRTQQRNKTLNLNYTLTLEEAYKGKALMLEIPLPSGRKQTIDTQIPAGIEDGMTIRLSGLGDDSIRTIPPGDIMITCKIQKHPIFKRDGCDLYQDLNVSVYDLILGNKIEVQTLSKNFMLTIPAGTQPGTTFSMKGHGMPIINAPGVGTMYVTIKGNVPKNINDNHKNLIEQARILTNTRKDV